MMKEKIVAENCEGVDVVIRHHCALDTVCALDVVCARDDQLSNVQKKAIKELYGVRY